MFTCMLLGAYKFVNIISSLWIVPFIIIHISSLSWVTAFNLILPDINTVKQTFYRSSILIISLFLSFYFQFFNLTSFLLSFFESKVQVGIKEKSTDNCYNQNFAILFVAVCMFGLNFCYLTLYFVVTILFLFTLLAFCQIDNFSLFCYLKAITCIFIVLVFLLKC